MERLPRMIVSVEGEEGSGKTRFALTAPRPITWLDFDFGLEGVEGADRVDAGNRHTYDLLSAEWMPEAQAQRYTKEVMQRFVADFRKAIADGARTLVVDTFTAAWRGQRVSRPEDKYAELEAEFLSLIAGAYASPSTNVILIHHMKIDWKRNQEGKSYPAGTKSRDGMDGIANAVQLSVRQRYIRPVPAQVTGGMVTKAAEPGRFEMDIMKSRDNIGLVGQTMPAMDFATLCAIACPSVDWSK